MDESLLVLTNGSAAAAAIARAGVAADIVPWDDVLYEGPLSGGHLRRLSPERAVALSRLGWGTVDDLRERFARRDTALLEAVTTARPLLLWFERDLYDQLQLAQILDTLHRHPHLRLDRVHLVQSDPFIAEADRQTTRLLFDLREPLTPALLHHAAAAWSAFTHPHPGPLAILCRTHGPLRYASTAARRLLEEYPDARSGLGRTHRQILEGLASGLTDPRDLFRYNQHAEADPFLGDASFWLRVAELGRGAAPLVLTARGRPFVPPPLAQPFKVAQQRLRLTARGRAVIEGRASAPPCPRYVGGVHLGPHHRWCRRAA